MLKKLVILLLIFSVVTGCKKDSQDTNPVIPDVSYRITISEIAQTVVGIEGSPQSVSFQIYVTTTEGLLAGDKSVTLLVSRGPGSMEAATVTTNSFGQAGGKYLVEMPVGQTQVTINARVETFSASTSFRLIGLTRPETLELEPRDQQFVVAREDDFEFPITAKVRDRYGNPVQGINVRFGLIVDTTVIGSRLFGSMTQTNPTNTSGESRSVFRANREYGRQKIFCEVNEPGGFLNDIRDEIRMEIIPLDDQIGFFLIRANRELMNVSPAQPETARVDIIVRDSQNRGLAEIRPEVTVNFGAFRGSTLTNENGQSQLLYVVNHQDLPDTATVAILYGSIPGTNWVSSASITLIPEAEGRSRLALMADRNVIYADNGVTIANLTAIVRSSNDDPLPDQLVEFTTTHGVAQSPVRTDASGFARSVFTDVGRASVDENGNPDSSVVTAKVRLLGIESSVRIMIRPFDNIESISLRPESNSISLGEGSSMVLRARCMKPGNIPAPDGFPVNFRAVNGRIFPQLALTETADAITEYFPPLFPGIDTLHAWITSDGQIMSTFALVEVVPGTPGRITISANPVELITNDPINFSNITASVFDEFANPLNSGIEVTFTTTRGTIRPTVLTDENGLAIAQLYTGDEPGLAEITASVRTETGTISAQTGVIFVIGNISTLELQANPINISVPEEGDGEITTLTASLFDEFGNPVDIPLSVVFHLQDDSRPPHGCVFPDGSQMIIVPSQDGIATVDLMAGQLIGMKRLRAFTFRDQAHQDTVVDYVQIFVTPGIPNDIDLNCSLEGWDVGNPNWGVDVVALVNDRWSNPAANGVQVFFELEPEIADITQGAIGNVNHAGNSFPGMAFAALTYSSSRTFETVEVLTMIDIPGGRISGNMDLQLPLQDGRLTAQPNVENWHFEEGQELANITITAVLRDGHDELINNGEVVFSTDAGHLRRYNIQTEEFVEMDRLNAVRFTGLNDPENAEEPGTASIYFQATADEIFQNPDDAQQRVFIDVRLHLYDEIQVDQIGILFTRVVQ